MKVLNVTRNENYSIYLLNERDYLRISVLKPTRCTDVSNSFYFGMILYMFRTVFPSIIRSSRLYIHCFLLASKQKTVSV